MLNTLALEDMATTLREILNIDSEIILNQTHLKELSQKIEEHFEGYKIITGEDGPLLILDNENFFTIYICGNKETQFYDLVRLFTFSILLDKKSLTQYELQHSTYKFPRFSTNHGADDYLMLAFMMPIKAFVSATTEYSSGDGSSIDMFKMQSEVNKYCYKRGIDLQMWSS